MEPRDRSKPTPASSTQLLGGGLAEMIFQRDPAETVFCCYRDGVTSEERQVEGSTGHLHVPFSPVNNLLTHGVVLFPSGASPFGDEDALRSKVAAFIHKYADVSSWFEEIASYYVLLSWIYDAFQEVPYLRLKGDFGSGKSRCLLTIGALCYKPMFVSGASTVSPMFRIIDSFRGTLILDESDFRFSDERAEIVKILNNGNAVGFPVLRSEATPTKEFNPRAFYVFGPKVIASRSLFDDAALESRCITEHMRGLPPRPDIPLSLPASFHEEALALRNELLMYRFQALSHPRTIESLRESGVEARVAQVFAPLLSIVKNSDARRRVIDVARSHTRAIRGERRASVEAQLLECIAAVKRDGVVPSIREIRDRFAERFGGDYSRPITPKWVGTQLRKRLALESVKTNGVFTIPPTEDVRLSALFARFEIDEVAPGLGDVRDVGAMEATHPMDVRPT